MKTTVIAMFLIIVTLGLAQQPAAPAFSTKVLTRAEFDHLAAAPDKLLIIDVRRPDEVSAIGGFPVYLSIQVADLEKSLAWIPKDRTIVTVSNHANRSGRAADLLTKNGFRVAGTIGVQTYEDAGGRLSKVEVPKPSNSDASGKQ
jgi:rhodanese-related sulfurtransferase